MSASAITAIQAGDGVGITAAVDGLTRAFDGAPAAQTRVGTDLRALGEQRERLSGVRLAAETEIKKLRDADLAASITGCSAPNRPIRPRSASRRAARSCSLFDYLR